AAQSPTAGWGSNPSLSVTSGGPCGARRDLRHGRCPMRRFAYGVPAAFTALVTLLTFRTAHAVAVAKCFDGNAQAVVRVPGQASQPVDWITCDRLVDGACSFTVERDGCGCAPKGCCGFDEFTVPVGRRRTVSQSFSGARLRLRCRRCPV